MLDEAFVVGVDVQDVVHELNVREGNTGVDVWDSGDMSDTDLDSIDIDDSNSKTEDDDDVGGMDNGWFTDENDGNEGSGIDEADRDDSGKEVTAPDTFDTLGDVTS